MSVIYLDVKQDGLVKGLEHLLEEARQGNLTSLVGVGSCSDDWLHFRGGDWQKDIYRHVGGLEIAKKGILKDVEEFEES